MIRARIGFGSGVLEYVYRDNILVVKTFNNRFELRPRIIMIDKAVGHIAGGSGKYKYVYVDYPEPIRPLPFQPTVGGRERIMIGNYEVRHTATGLGDFHTILTPGVHLYYYVIVSDDRMAVETGRNREVYFDESGGPLIIYFV